MAKKKPLSQDKALQTLQGKFSECMKFCKENGMHAVMFALPKNWYKLLEKGTAFQPSSASYCDLRTVIFWVANVVQALARLNGVSSVRVAREILGCVEILEGQLDSFKNAEEKMENGKYNTSGVVRKRKN